MIGFCGGRIDNEDGSESIPLGPSELQQDLMPCGDDICPVDQICPGCQLPLGAAFMGLSEYEWLYLALHLYCRGASSNPPLFLVPYD